MKEKNMNAIFGYIGAMLPYMLSALPAILLFRYIHNKVRKNHIFTLSHEVGVVFFLLYMTAVFSQTILTFLYTGPKVTREYSNVNLVPFRVFQDNYYAITELAEWQPFIINFLGNICIFIPIGLFLPLLWKGYNRLWKVTLMGFFISLFIETAQLGQARSSDIDDLWLNTVGAIVGYILYKILITNSPKLANAFKKRKQ
jgi:glycopeptide antibiotics resistance protein